MTEPTPTPTNNDLIASMLDKALNRLTKWRRLLAAWHHGARVLLPGQSPKLDSSAEVAATIDSEERLLIFRAELSALTSLLIQKGVISVQEFNHSTIAAADDLNMQLSKAWPGISADATGLTFSYLGVVTMNERGFKDLDLFIEATTEQPK